MLRLKTVDGTYCVDFLHPELLPWELERYTGEDYAGDGYAGDKRRCTFAIVRLEEKEIARGISICHPKDNFCKAIGRKRSLTDAISFFPRNMRSLFWKVYQQESGV